MSALHEDLLFKIFLENTYDGPHHPFRDEDDSPLTTALQCSQVCRQWRSIFLSSSLIWGRLIDLNVLKTRTDKWREEIFARNGEAVLWLYGYVDRDVWNFMSPFLQKNWRRVQVLVIRDLNTLSMISLDLQKEMWAFMKEPAPLLSRIDVDHQFPSISGLPTSSLFGDDAPLLRDFKLRYEFPENASWLSNLSSMSFPPSLNTEEVLTTLQWMPRLEYLSVSMDSNSFNDFYIPPPPVVVLPNLRMLQMYGDIQDTCTILESITPSPDCCLAVEIDRKNRAVLDDSRNKQYEDAVKSYIMPYFSLNPPSSMKFFIDADILVLEHPIPPLLHYDNSWERCFRIMFNIHFLSSSSLIKELIGSPWVPYIKKFQFYAWSIPNSPSGLDNDTVISALGALSSFVTALHTDDPTLEGLLQRPLSYTSTLFPVLTTLKIDSLWRPAHAQEEPAHHRFLKIRKEIGRPISVLDWGVIAEKPGDLGYFKEHAGLLVKWETWDGHREEYLCGEGHPERHGFESDPYRRI